MYQYLRAIIGNSASEALEKSLKTKSHLNNNILPITFHAWLETVNEYDGLIPGSDVAISIHKIGNVFDGFIKSDSLFLPIGGKTAWYVSAAMCLAVNASPDFNCEDQELWALKKNLDRLVHNKNKTVRKSVFHIENLKKTNYSIPLNNVNQTCPACGKQILDNGSFISCMCFLDISSQIKVYTKNNSLVVTFSKSLPRSAIQSVYKTLRKA